MNQTYSSAAKSNALVHDLLSDIHDGKWSVGTRLPAERKLADDRNVSRSTVRQALKQLEAMGVLRSVQGSGNYVADNQPVANTPATITMILPDGMNLRQEFARNTFYSELLAGVTTSFEGHHTKLAMMPFSEGLLRRAQHSRHDTQAVFGQGILLVNSRLPGALVEGLVDLELPMVAVGRPQGNAPVSYLDSDHVSCMEQCIHHLMDQGHQHIGLLNTPHYSRHARERFETWKMALESDGIRVQDNWSIQFDVDHPQDSQEDVQKLLASGELTALVVVPENAIMMVLNMLDKLDVHVPDAFSVMTYGESQLNTLVTPQVSAIELPTFRIGCEAATLIQEDLTRDRRVVRERLLPGRLIARGSSGPCIAHLHSTH